MSKSVNEFQILLEKNTYAYRIDMASSVRKGLREPNKNYYLFCYWQVTKTATPKDTKTLLQNHKKLRPSFGLTLLKRFDYTDDNKAFALYGFGETGSQQSHVQLSECRNIPMKRILS